MSEELQRWTQVEDYLCETLSVSDPILDAVLAECAAARLPEIQVSPNEGKLLNLIARIHGARRILEIGTLGGYSAIWLARALPENGEMLTIELEPDYAAVAEANLDRAGMHDRVELRIGDATGVLRTLADEKPKPFDLIFIDADKPNNPKYLDWALKLSREGTVIIVDNVVRDGSVIDSSSEDPSVRGSRVALEKLAADEGMNATAIQTVGSKGYDGMAIGIVCSPDPRVR